ncbi:MAG TPA: LiaF domain-containing protein [Acidimicrobiales bacterium]|nr:LiaF domain-containing protein [Acidimicrobiales bacterium]
MSSTEDDHFLPSEIERTTALEALDSSAVEGRLGLEDYLRLTDQLAVARTRADLVAVTSRVEAAIEPARPLKRRWWVVLGNRIYRGRFVLPERTKAVVVTGEIHLDLRGATLVGAAPSIRLKVLVGSLRVLVPAGVGVEVDQSSLFGGRKVVRFGGEQDPRRPTIRVRVVDVFGNVHVTDDPARWSPAVLPAGEPVARWVPRPLSPGASGARAGAVADPWHPGAEPAQASEAAPGGPPSQSSQPGSVPDGPEQSTIPQG